MKKGRRALFLTFCMYLILGQTLSLHAQEAYSSAIATEEVLRVVNDAARWQMAHMPERGRTIEYNPRNRGWADGVFLSALSDWAVYTDNQEIIEWYEEIAYKQQWEVGHRSLNPANDIAVSLLYANIWERNKKPRYLVSDITDLGWNPKTVELLAGGWGPLIPTIERLDYQMKYYPQTDNLDFNLAVNQERWCWCDALYMAAPTYARFANITGKDAYREFMDREFWCTMNTLYDKEEHLVFRDTRYMEAREANGEKVFWGRGNGWVAGAFARVLTYLPEDYPSRPQYVRVFREIMSRIVSLQDEEGYWHTSLLDPESFPSPETSASGFYTYALWWGINQGILDQPVYLQAAIQAWQAMVKAVQPTGMLGYVQPIGDAPENVSARKNEVYGTAAFMLAGREVVLYSEKKEYRLK